MIKKSVKTLHNFAVGIPELEKSEVIDDFEYPAAVEKASPSDAIIKMVYARDERTKLPTGDLRYYVSDKANPEVKRWILDNLMMDTSGAANPKIPAGMDDETAMIYQRNVGESTEAYVSRLQNLNEETARMAIQAQKALKDVRPAVSDGSAVSSK